LFYNVLHGHIFTGANCPSKKGLAMPLINTKENFYILGCRMAVTRIFEFKVICSQMSEEKRIL